MPSVVSPNPKMGHLQALYECRKYPKENNNKWSSINNITLGQIHLSFKKTSKTTKVGIRPSSGLLLEFQEKYP